MCPSAGQVGLSVTNAILGGSCHDSGAKTTTVEALPQIP